jgi:cleavage and polyadenylation specificity factor subunit 5
MTTTVIFNLETNYNIGVGAMLREKDQSFGAKFERMRHKYETQGTRRTVAAAMVVHVHSHPHVLLLQRKSDQSLVLPGGTLKPGEGDIDGLSRKLTEKLASASIVVPKWDVGELLGQFWRPEFDASIYPYTPPHVTKPKECKKIFLVTLLNPRVLARISRDPICFARRVGDVARKVCFCCSDDLQTDRCAAVRVAQLIALSGRDRLAAAAVEPMHFCLRVSALAFDGDEQRLRLSPVVRSQEIGNKKRCGSRIVPWLS